MDVSERMDHLASIVVFSQHVHILLVCEYISMTNNNNNNNNGHDGCLIDYYYYYEVDHQHIRVYTRTRIDDYNVDIIITIVRMHANIQIQI